MSTGRNPARQRAALYKNFCKVRVPSDHETSKLNLCDGLGPHSNPFLHLLRSKT
jgi:hypothetical protein